MFVFGVNFFVVFILGSTCQKLICLEMSRFGGCWMWHDRVDCAPDHAITISPTVARSPVGDSSWENFLLQQIENGLEKIYKEIHF